MSDKCYSTDEERFYDQSLDETVQDATEYEGVKTGDTVTVFEGESVPINPCSLIQRYHAESFLEDVEQMMYEEVGDLAESWPYANNAQVDALLIKLQAAFVSWLKEHDFMPKFLKVINVREIRVKVTAVTEDRVEWELIEADNRQEDA